MVDVPPGVLAIELTVTAFQIPAAFNGRLTVGDSNIFQEHVVGPEERTLASKT